MSNAFRTEAPRAVGLMLLGVLGAAWLLVRAPVFLVLLWLRPAVNLVFGAIGAFALLGFLLSLLLYREYPEVVVGSGALSFGAFLFLWIYDSALLFVAPKDMVMLLDQ